MARALGFSKSSRVGRDVTVTLLRLSRTRVPLTMNDSDDQKERERRNVTKTGFPPMNNASAADGLIWKWESSAKPNWILLVVAQTAGIFRNPKKNIINNKRSSQRVYPDFFGWHLANGPRCTQQKRKMEVDADDGNRTKRSEKHISLFPIKGLVKTLQTCARLSRTFNQLPHKTTPVSPKPWQNDGSRWTHRSTTLSRGE